VSCIDASITAIAHDGGENESNPVTTVAGMPAVHVDDVYRDPTFIGNPRLVDRGTECAVCHCTGLDIGRPLFKCGSCRVVSYCSVEHQKLDWKKKHKSLCGTLIATGRELQAQDNIEAYLKKVSNVEEKLKTVAVATDRSPLLRELAHICEYRIG